MIFNVMGMSELTAYVKKKNLSFSKIISEKRKKRENK